MLFVYKIISNIGSVRYSTLSLHVTAPMYGVVEYTVADAGLCNRRQETFIMYSHRPAYVSHDCISL